MSDPNRNARWCRCIAEELARAGTALVVLCPGSRNSPLLFALADAFAPAPGERDRRLSHIDERSAAFIALGAAKAAGRPAVVCVTSGSAVANCAPALAEAKAAGVALIVLAADRPWELHGCGAPQTMPQRGAFTAFVDHVVEECSELCPRQFRAGICYGLHEHLQIELACQVASHFVQCFGFFPRFTFPLQQERPFLFCAFAITNVLRDIRESS